MLAPTSKSWLINSLAQVVLALAVSAAADAAYFKTEFEVRIKKPPPDEYIRVSVETAQNLGTKSVWGNARIVTFQPGGGLDTKDALLFSAALAGEAGAPAGAAEATARDGYGVLTIEYLGSMQNAKFGLSGSFKVHLKTVAGNNEGATAAYRFSLTNLATGEEIPVTGSRKDISGTDEFKIDNGEFETELRIKPKGKASLRIDGSASGSATATPEPGSGALVVIGAITALCRRRAW